MPMTRRTWLSIVAAGVAGALTPLRSLAAQDGEQRELERRIGRLIDEYGQQGFHRTGTAVDRRSGDWLYDEVRRIGLPADRESFLLGRVDPGKSVLIVQDRRIEGLPLFDGAFTAADGIRGRLGPINSDAEIGLAEAPPNTAGAGAIGEARRQQRHKAIVFVTRGGRPGLCPSNADRFLDPFGPPVLQVSSDESAFLTQQAQARAEVQLIARATRSSATAFNVTAAITGRDRGLAPLVVMTPRSGWYACASERGGGIACWLELIRTLRAATPTRDVLFVASSGHELGHLGIDAYVARRPGIVPKTVGWIHLGANIGAATRPGDPPPAAGDDPALRHATPVLGPANTIQASDDEFESILSRAMSAGGLAISRRNPRGTIPGGEAETVHRGGGRYVSVIGSNALFHNPDDRGPQAVDVSAIARFSKAFAVVADALVRTDRLAPEARYAPKAP
ncbi:MAG: hypothetical protein Q7R30_04425 [Acidobacteriota bacterium]|nr:hypothetical protein [Acidobacteriota bacterium]